MPDRVKELDDLEAIRAELKRRGTAPAQAPSGGSDAYLVILAEAVNHLAKSVAEMRASTAKQTADILAAQANVQPRVRTIERDADGNIVRIVEE